jgi:UDP-glucuronate 4-epimerase
MVQAAGIIHILKGYEIFNLGKSSAVSLKNLVSILERCTKKKAKINYLPMQEGDVIQTYADISKARKKIHYNPVIDIETGLNKYVEDFMRMDILSDNRRNGIL